MTIEQRLDHDAEANECQDFLVILQERFDERIDRRQRAGGLLGGKDDEVLILLVIVQLDIVVFLVVVIIIIRRRRRRLIAADATGGGSGRGKLVVEFGRNRIVRGSGDPVIRRWKLGRHETN